MTILAWSNSIGDLIADISVVRQGYPRMAISAAIGGPLFSETYKNDRFLTKNMKMA